MIWGDMFISIILDLLKPESGFVKFAKNNLENSIKEKIAYVPQTFSLYNNLTVLENINLIASCYGLKQKNIQNQTKEILEFTSLYEYKDRFAEKLSGGMKQKLALASALIHNPEIIFLDEPTTGVDPVSRREFWQLLHYINRQGTTIIVSTPYMDEAELCTRKMFINNGRILDVGTSEELLSRYDKKILRLELDERRAKDWLMKCGHVCDANLFGTNYHIVVDDADAAAGEIRKELDQRYSPLPDLFETTPSLEDLFVAFSGGALPCRVPQ